MKDSEIHSTLFRGVIARLNNLSGGDGRNIADGNDELAQEFYIAYQRRPAERFAHNYERDKFLHSRDRYSMVNIHGNHFMVAKVKSNDHVTIYRNIVKMMFGIDGDRAVATLERLIHKFYDDVEIQDVSDITEADYSSGNSGNNYRLSNAV